MTQTLHLGFTGIPGTALLIEDDLNADAVVSAILAIPAVSAALRAKIAAEVAPRYRRGEGLAQDALDAAADAYLRGGEDGLCAWAETIVDDDREEEILRALRDDPICGNILTVIDLAVAAATNREPNPAGLDSEALTALIREGVDGMDRSQPRDLIGSRDEVLVCYVPAYEFGFEDDAILGHGKSLRPCDVELVGTAEEPRLPEGYLAYLGLVNADPDALQAHLARYDRPPTGPAAEDSGHAEAWRRADWGYDPTRPSLHDAHAVRTVLENAGDCAVTTLTMRVPLRDLLALDFAEPIRIAPRDRGHAQAGFINFVHGAGYDAPIRQPIVVQAERRKWHCAETNGYGYDSIFNIVPSALAVEIANAEPAVYDRAA